jgi:NAD(P)-dependent dehydrogenase (short-subunit alcohol dehydrogenase family)
MSNTQSIHEKVVLITGATGGIGQGAARLKGTGVTVNALHPGVVRSGFGHNNRTLVGRVTSGVLRLLQRFGGVDVVEGADTAVYLASAPEVAHVTGAY